MRFQLLKSPYKSNLVDLKLDSRILPRWLLHLLILKFVGFWVHSFGIEQFFQIYKVKP